MLQKVKPAGWMAIILICFTGMAGLAWQTNPVRSNNVQRDTLPLKGNIGKEETIINGDLDKTLEDVQKAQLNLEKQLQNKDWEKMQKDLLKMQTELNTQNIQEQVAKAMKQIDLQKIQLQTQEALKQIDMEKVQKELEKARVEMKATFDDTKIEKEVQRAMQEASRALAQVKTVDMEKMQRQLEKAKEEMKLDQGHLQEELENMKKQLTEDFPKNLQKELEKAKAEIDRAKEELQDYKNMLDEMQKDGLITSKEEYTIKYKKGELYINGVKQPETVTNKYKHYFKKEDVKLKRSKNDNDDDSKTITL